jgi:hypothetical protein
MTNQDWYFAHQVGAVESAAKTAGGTLHRAMLFGLIIQTKARTFGTERNTK